MQPEERDRQHRDIEASKNWFDYGGPYKLPEPHKVASETERDRFLKDLNKAIARCGARQHRGYEKEILVDKEKVPKTMS